MVAYKPWSSNMFLRECSHFLQSWKWIKLGKSNVGNPYQEIEKNMLHKKMCLFSVGKYGFRCKKNIRNTDGTTSCHHDFSWNLPSLWGYLGHNQGFLLAAAADTNRVGQVWVGWGSSWSHTCEVVQLLKHLTSRRCFFSWLFFCWWFRGKVRLVILPWFFKDVDLQVRADFSWQAYQDLMEGGGSRINKKVAAVIYILVVLSSKPTA